jgi:hypothetical protein
MLDISSPTPSSSGIKTKEPSQLLAEKQRKRENEEERRREAKKHDIGQYRKEEKDRSR